MKPNYPMETIYVIHYWNAESPPSSGVHTITNDETTAKARWKELIFYRSGREEWYLATETYDEWNKFVDERWSAKEYDDGEWNIYTLGIYRSFTAKPDYATTAEEYRKWAEYSRLKAEGKSDEEAYGIAVGDTIE